LENLEKIFSILIANNTTTSDIKTLSSSDFKNIKLPGFPSSYTDLGHYLAGLIEGDGHVSKISIVIVFHSDDISVANYLKTRIGAGNVSQVKNKRQLFWFSF
jgi:hypothetical protein